MPRGCWSWDWIPQLTYGLLLQSRRTIVGDAFQWFCDISDFAVWMIEKPEFVKEFLGIFQEWALGLTKLALESRDTVLIDKAVKEAIGMLGGRQGFILGAFLFQQVTAKSILSMIDAWKKYRQEYS